MFYRRLVAACLIGLCSFQFSAFAQEKTVPKAEPEQVPNRTAQFNIFVGPDERLFVAMAAINFAGFDLETPDSPPNQLRAELKKDLASTPADLTEKMRQFFQSIPPRERNRPQLAAAVAALAISATPLPDFKLPASSGVLPDDALPLANFAPLVAEFYARSPIKSLIPKYAGNYNSYGELLQAIANLEVTDALSFLHTAPITESLDAPAMIDPNSARRDNLPSSERKRRTRALYIIPDLLGPFDRVYTRNDILNAGETKTYRRIGDDFFLVLGAPRETPQKAVRRTILRFILEPVIARSGLAIASRRDLIVKLAETAPKRENTGRSNVFEIMRESLSRAVEARLGVRAIQLELRRRGITAAGQPALIAAEEDALFEVHQARERGASLAVHFYEQLAVLDQTGLDILEWLPKMVENIDEAKEKKRPAEFAELGPRVEKRRAEAAAKIVGSPKLAKLAQADDFLRARKYDEARPILEEILKEEPKNARALFGLAEIMAKRQTPIEADPAADESDKLAALQERLEAAVGAYVKAVEAAKPEEKWLVSQSLVMMGKIYDFADRRADAVAAYEKAIALGDVKDGAYAEAVKGKAQPLTPVPKEK